MTDEKPAYLHHGDTEVELPVVRGTEDELGVDISKLRAETGLVTLDYGFVNTGSCESAITFIDGEQGILRYRGIPIEAMVSGHSPSFLETAYLLIYGELPTRAERDEFSRSIRKHTLLHEDAKRFFDGFPRNAHPMGALSSVVSALSTFYPDSSNPHDPDQVQLAIVRLIAKLPTIAAYSYKKSIGQPFLYPNNELDLIENFLTMMFAVPSEPYQVSPTVVHALKILLILHADHEQNCSTSTVRLVGSSEANLFASVAAGINALWGPLHGGANQAVIEMLEAIRANGNDVDAFVARAKDPDDPFQPLGFRPPRLSQLRPTGPDHQGAGAPGHRGARAHGRPPRPCAAPRGRGDLRQLLRGAQALPERRLLLGPHLPRDGLPDPDVPGPVRARASARLDRALERDDGEPPHEDRASPPDLRGPGRAGVRADRPAR